MNLTLSLLASSTLAGEPRTLEDLQGSWRLAPTGTVAEMFHQAEFILRPTPPTHEEVLAAGLEDPMFEIITHMRASPGAIAHHREQYEQLSQTIITWAGATETVLAPAKTLVHPFHLVQATADLLVLQPADEDGGRREVVQFITDDHIVIGFEGEPGRLTDNPDNTVHMTRIVADVAGTGRRDPPTSTEKAVHGAEPALGIHELHDPGEETPAPGQHPPSPAPPPPNAPTRSPQPQGTTAPNPVEDTGDDTGTDTGEPETPPP